MIEEIIAFFSPFPIFYPKHPTVPSRLINGENEISPIKRCSWTARISDKGHAVLTSPRFSPTHILQWHGDGCLTCPFIGHVPNDSAEEPQVESTSASNCR